MHLDAFEQLVHLVVAELLAEAGQDVSQLAGADKAVAVLVKHLEAADELFGRAGGLEAVGSVEDVEKRVVVDVLGRGVGEVGHFGLGWVLAERTEEVAERLARDGAGALLVEERKGLLVLCVRLGERSR